MEDEKIKEFLINNLKDIVDDLSTVSLSVGLKTVNINNNIFKINQTWNDDFDEEQIALEIFKQVECIIKKLPIFYNIKFLMEIISLKAKLFYINDTKVVIKKENNRKEIDKNSNLKCFKNDSIKEIVDYIVALNKEEKLLSEEMIYIIKGFINNNSNIDYYSLIIEQLTKCDSSEIEKYIQIFFNKLIIKFKINLNVKNDKLLNRKYYFQVFKNNKLINKNDLFMIHGLTKNFTILSKSNFLKEKKYFDNEKIKKAEEYICSFLTFLENKVTSKLNKKVKVINYNILKRTITIMFVGENEAVIKELKI